jgi:Rieske Fe-S protein
MGIQKPISRNTFFRITSGLILGLIGWIWYRLSGFQIEHENRMEYRHGLDLPMGLSYYEKYYLFRSDQSVRAFLTKCTHAGCRIGLGTATTLQCNCHGSQFDAKTGNPLKGPAIKPLQEIECRYDEKNGQWVVRLNPVVSKLSKS